MSTDTDSTDIPITDSSIPDEAVAGHETEHGFSDRQYIQVAVILAVITALEVYASYADWLGAAFVPLLMFMMAIKFVMVLLFFMHLKFDHKIFSWLFYAGLLLAVGVYVGALLTFKFFDS